MKKQLPTVGRLPAYGKALLQARLDKQISDAMSVSVYVALDEWAISPEPELGKYALAIKAEDDPAGFDWRVVAGLMVIVLHRNAPAERVAALCTALLAVNPAGLHVLNRASGEYQIALPFFAETGHD